MKISIEYLLTDQGKIKTFLWIKPEDSLYSKLFKSPYDEKYHSNHIEEFDTPEEAKKWTYDQKIKAFKRYDYLRSIIVPENQEIEF